MEIKLIKLGNDKYTLIYKKEGMTVEHNPAFDGKLSLKNCQAIENGYDLMKLAEENSHKYYDVKTTDWHCNYNGFFSGFQKALEILGDKKFSEGDVISMIKKSREKTQYNFDGKCTEYKFSEDELIQSLQPKEWDVEIVTKPFVSVGLITADFSGDTPINVLNVKKEVVEEGYSLDADGCLILKRKV